MSQKKHQIKTVEEIVNLINKDNFQEFMAQFELVMRKIVDIKTAAEKQGNPLPKALLKEFNWVDDEVETSILTINGRIIEINKK
jgi:hypothetical protein